MALGNYFIFPILIDNGWASFGDEQVCIIIVIESEI